MNDSAFAIIASRFNAGVVERLIDGAVKTLMARSVSEDHIDIYRVPGAWELPAAVQTCQDLERYDALIALGCVIRGETPHFEYISAECTRGLGKLARNGKAPVLFGLITADTQEQADQRSAMLSDWGNPELSHGEESNKGSEAALAALQMAAFRKFGEPSHPNDDGEWR